MKHPADILGSPLRIGDSVVHYSSWTSVLHLCEIIRIVDTVYGFHSLSLEEVRTNYGVQQQSNRVLKVSEVPSIDAFHFASDEILPRDVFGQSVEIGDWVVSGPGAGIPGYQRPAIWYLQSPEGLVVDKIRNFYQYYDPEDSSVLSLPLELVKVTNFKFLPVYLLNS